MIGQYWFAFHDVVTDVIALTAFTYKMMHSKASDNRESVLVEHDVVSLPTFLLEGLFSHSEGSLDVETSAAIWKEIGFNKDSGGSTLRFLGQLSSGKNSNPSTQLSPLNLISCSSEDLNSRPVYNPRGIRRKSRPRGDTSAGVTNRKISKNLPFKCSKRVRSDMVVHEVIVISDDDEPSPKRRKLN